MIDKQKKIFIISPTESALTKRGDRHTRLAIELTKDGYDVVYISTNFYHAEKRFFSKDEIADVQNSINYSLKIFSTFSYNDNISLGRLIGYFKLALQSFVFLLIHMNKNDILLVPSRPPEFIFIARILKIIKRNRLIIDIRDVWPDGLPLKNNIIHRLFRGYCNILNRLSMVVADHAFYTAEGFKQWALRYINDDKLSFIPLGYDEQRWESSKPLNLTDFTGDIIKFVFVGDLAKSMEISGLIEAVAKSKKCSLTFIGGGERLDEMKRLVNSLNVDNITFMGRLTKTEVVSAMGKFHISVIPLNVKFSMPNKLFDAIGAQRPLLIYGDNDAANFALENNIGWKLDFCSNQENDFINKLSVSEIINFSDNIGKIRKIYSKGQLYQNMIAKILE